jgi:hypothetical protein
LFLLHFGGITAYTKMEFNLDTYSAFTDYEMVFGQVSRNLLWGILTENGLPCYLTIAFAKSLFENHQDQDCKGWKNDRRNQPTCVTGVPTFTSFI